VTRLVHARQDSLPSARSDMAFGTWVALQLEDIAQPLIAGHGGGLTPSASALDHRRASSAEEPRGGGFCLCVHFSVGRAMFAAHPTAGTALVWRARHACWRRPWLFPSRRCGREILRVDAQRPSWRHVGSPIGGAADSHLDDPSKRGANAASPGLLRNDKRSFYR